MANFRLGCAVWSFRGWLGDFYPKSSQSKNFLKLYGDRLNAVEGNTTFYSVPSEETVKRWREQTPDDFRFCLKFPQTVTHQGLLMPQLAQAETFIERVKPLGDRLGCIFAQLPPSYSPTQFPDLKNFFSSLTNSGVQLGVETRHLRWFTEQHQQPLIEFLEEQQVTKVLLDTRPIYNCPDNPQAQSQRKKPEVPLHTITTSSQAMVRFISHPQNTYNETYLDAWVDQIQTWLAANKSIYFFVHCPLEEHSPAIALHLQKKLQAKNVPINPLPWQQLPPEPEQLSLF